MHFYYLFTCGKIPTKMIILFCVMYCVAVSGQLYGFLSGLPNHQLTLSTHHVDGLRNAHITKTKHFKTKQGAHYEGYTLGLHIHDGVIKWEHFSRYWPLCGEFIGHRWIPRIKAGDAKLDVFFYLRLIERLSKQSWGWWFETSLRPLWRPSNAQCQHINP